MIVVFQILLILVMILSVLVTFGVEEKDVRGYFAGISIVSIISLTATFIMA